MVRRRDGSLAGSLPTPRKRAVFSKGLGSSPAGRGLNVRRGRRDRWRTNGDVKCSPPVSPFCPVLLRRQRGENEATSTPLPWLWTSLPRDSRHVTPFARTGLIFCLVDAGIRDNQCAKNGPYGFSGDRDWNSWGCYWVCLAVVFYNLTLQPLYIALVSMWTNADFALVQAFC